MSTLQTVHVRVNDAGTGKPTPVRIRFATPAGGYFAPLGRLARFPVADLGIDVGGNVLVGSRKYAYIDGTCEVQLPPGPLTVEIGKGPEYRPLHTSILLAPGKLALRFELERWTDMRAGGWYSGDTRAHFLTPPAALLEGAAEDVAVVNLLAWECRLRDEEGRTYPAVPNLLAFSGQRPALEMPGHLVVVNTMNIHAVLGRLLLLNCHRVVYPLFFGSPAAWDNWTLADWCDQCHRKAGLVIGDDFAGQGPGEILADLLLGKVDALQMDGFENPRVAVAFKKQARLRDWYDLLDCGFRVPLTGGSGKTCNLDVVGQPRTYARLEPGQEFTYKNWIEAVRAGRTFVTNGPLLSFTVNDRDPGAVIDLAPGASTVHAHAEARCLAPFRRLEVIANNTVVAAAAPTGEPACAVVDADVLFPAGGWLAARCWGDYDDRMEAWLAAQTSPVYVQIEGRPPPADPAAVARLTHHLEKMLDWVRDRARCENESQRQRLAGIFESAREVLAKRGG